MIVGTQKPIDEIWSMVKDFKKVLVFGCTLALPYAMQAGKKRLRQLLP